MICIVAANVLDRKIVDNQTEADGSCGMLPVSWCQSALVKTVFAQTRCQLLIGKYACLRESIHSLFNSYVDTIVCIDLVFKLVLTHYFFRNQAAVKFHEFRFGQRGSQVKILNIKAGHLRSWGG